MDSDIELPPSLQVFYTRAYQMAKRVVAGGIPLNEAVDLLYSGAQWSGLTEKYGDDKIQALMADAVIFASMGEAA